MLTKDFNFSPDDLKYTGVIGTGGIGSGKFFVLNGDQTLGREESRSGHFLKVNDYCKQHIILHYLKVLLGRNFSVMPVGRVGDDEIGRSLFKEMGETGFIMNYVEIMPAQSTLFSFCFSYPNGDGGNLTTDNSASSQLDPVCIEEAASEIIRLGSKGMIMAAPEVPIEARRKLLQLGRKNGLFCAASFTSEEIMPAMESDMINIIDLIALNIDEASAVNGRRDDAFDKKSIVSNAVQKLKMLNKDIMVTITAGKDGSFSWDGSRLLEFPSIKAESISTAGAGDAFFSGLLCGIALGMTLFEAQQLGTLVAGLSVTSPHTIHKGIDRSSLNQFHHNSDLVFTEKIKKLLED